MIHALFLLNSATYQNVLEKHIVQAAIMLYELRIIFQNGSHRVYTASVQNSTTFFRVIIFTTIVEMSIKCFSNTLLQFSKICPLNQN